MASDRDELNAALRSVADAMLAREREHPSAEELVRHFRGELLGADQERIQDHLAICLVCARLRLALPQLQAGERVPADSDASAAEDFERLRFALSAEARLRPEPKADIWYAKVDRRSLWRRFTLAAALLVAFGLGWMLAKIETTRELRPAINLPMAVLTLDPDRQTTETLFLPAEAELLMVVISLPDAADRCVYRIRVSHRESLLSWTSPPIEPRHGEITLTFATSEVRPGFYDLMVDQLHEAGSRRIGETSLRIRSDDGGR